MIGQAAVDPLPLVRDSSTVEVISTDGITLAAAKEVFSSARASAVSLRWAYIENPDLVVRFRLERPPAEFYWSTLYTLEAHGYTDDAHGT